MRKVLTREGAKYRCVPDISLLVFSVPGATPISVGVLMLMHVAAFLLSVGMLTRLARQTGTVPGPHRRMSSGEGSEERKEKTKEGLGEPTRMKVSGDG